MQDKTMTFYLGDDNDRQMKDTMLKVYEALKAQGYNPINQIVGYILSEDPTYITNFENARSLVTKIDRDELLQSMVKFYLNN